MTSINGTRKTRGVRRTTRRMQRHSLSSLSPLPSPLSPNSSDRRGVLLLVVLALLAIFGLIAVAFVVMTGQAQMGAEVAQRVEQVAQSPKNELQQAVMQVLRGTTDVNPIYSAMGPHSLLEDVYGNSVVSGSIGAAQAACGGQLWEIPVSPAGSLANRGGCVLTITGPNNNPSYGQSTRIVGFNPTNNNPLIMAFPDGSNPSNAQFQVNGVPFSGTGFGGSPMTDLALKPNDMGNRFSTGVANEDYDATDYQNILLGAQVYNVFPAGMSVTKGIGATMAGNSVLQTLPSMHRPTLVCYWAKKADPAADFTTVDKLAAAAQAIDSNTNPSLCPPMRSIVLRPLPGDHKGFTGSNPAFKTEPKTLKDRYKDGFNPCWDGGVVTDASGRPVDPQPFSWDVDNNGDGVPDSVWVDLGMPVRMNADGRLYKPLFAILCVDLDGRLNLNAHGSLAQLDTSALMSLAGSTATDNNVRGQGFGPAEINLQTLLGDAATYSQLMDAGVTGYVGRYGTRKFPGTKDVDSILANKWFEYGPSYGLNYWTLTDANNAGSYGTPPDPFGVGGVTLDAAGRPVYKWTTTGNYGFGSGINNSPYQFNLGPNAVRGVSDVNSPFSPAELERLLRPFDRDATSLPARLAWLTTKSPLPTKPESVLLGTWAAGVLTPDRAKQLSFTTEGWDFPCPAVPDAKRIVSLLQARHVPQAMWKDVVAPDMLIGLKMNINRPFGNGKDDATANGVVDEQYPTETEQVTLNGGSVTMNYNETGTYKDKSSDTTEATITPLAARQLEARYLYVIACLTCDRDSLKDMVSLSGDDADTKNAKAAKFLAQWAVNVVDFKDRDSIMTKFDYDHEFFSGTISDGWNPSKTVWGCERPELLLTETLAFHDRATEETEAEDVDSEEGDSQDSTTPAKTTATTPTKPDGSFDQKKKPAGSFFVELYNPWTDREPPCGEFRYDSATSSMASGVRLHQTSAEGNDPVWRMLVVVPQGDPAAGDYVPLDPDDPDANDPEKAKRRCVYFAQPTKVYGDDGEVRFYPSTTAQFAPIKSGRYAVVGPGLSASGTSTTYIGYQNTDPNHNGDNTTRRIELTPNTNPDTQQVKVYADGAAVDSPGASSVQPSVAIVIDQAAGGSGTTIPRMSLTEPVNGYPVYEDTTNQQYNPIRDMPLDAKLNKDLWDSNLKDNGTTPRFRVVYLQRLANPLKAWDASTNPYRTVDFMQVDLTSFNGVTATPDLGTKTLQVNKGITFYSRQRGEKNDPSHQPNIWSHEPETAVDKPTATSPKAAPTNCEITDQFASSLGYLNEGFGAPSTVAGHIGDPTSAFPWLTWNNRPYVSPLELMQVPCWSSSQLLLKYKIGQVEAGESVYTKASLPFPHLTNMLLSGPSTSPKEELHRTFEYLGVPSPFVGTETWANPSSTLSSPYLAPFNRISSFREPGRINLNTIYSSDVFNALMAGCPNATPTWQQFVQSRSGSTTTNILQQTDPAVPTEFAHPFRSFTGANLVPSGIPGLEPKPNKEINATLLREIPAGGKPLFDYTSTNANDNTDRNPYFRYQALQRLSNLTTTRSNVYAVWITVGYFEVEKWSSGIDAGHPDGYTLKGEVGIDTGNIERHRAFYIIDRSIPVGFKRGQDMNAEKAILLNRFIE